MVKFILIIIMSLLVSILLKSYKNGISALFVIAITVSLLICALSMIKPIIDFITTLTDKTGINDSYIKVILKCIGICILGDFTAGLCRDNGESSLALNAEFICKCSLLVISIPIYADVFNMIVKLWENK